MTNSQKNQTYVRHAVASLEQMCQD